MLDGERTWLFVYQNYYLVRHLHPSVPFYGSGITPLMSVTATTLEVEPRADSSSSTATARRSRRCSPIVSRSWPAIASPSTTSCPARLGATEWPRRARPREVTG